MVWEKIPGRSHYKFYGGGVWTSWFKIIFTANVKIQHFIVSGGSRSRGVPPPNLFLDQTCSEVLLLLVKSWKLERHIVLLMKKPSGLPWSFKPQYQYAYSSHCFDTSAGENLFKDKDISLWWSFPSFSWPVCLIRQCYYWEKLDAGHFWPGALGLNKK